MAVTGDVRSLAPERARRELRHLYRLLEKHTWRDRMSMAIRGGVGFGVALLVAVKLALFKTLAAKVVFGFLIALLAALPVLVGWLIATVFVLLAAVSVVALLFGELVEPPSLIDPPDCRYERARLRKLKQMIAEREAIAGRM